MTALPLQQAARLAADAGFSGDGLRTILAIAQAESGLDPTAVNTAGNTPPSRDRGILQINDYWHAEVTDAQAFDPAWAFTWAYAETKQGTDFHEWATYTGGAYKSYPVTHLELPGFLALSEFSGGHNDDCGPDGELIALAVEKAEPLTPGELDAIRNRDIARGWFTPGGGEPLSSILADLKAFENVAILDYVPYQDWAGDDAHAEAVHTALKQWAGVQPLVLQLLNAQALTGNEGGVHSHFVAVGGIDDQLGYLVANGDDINALAPGGYQQTYPGRWVGWQTILAAQPAGCIVLKASSSAPAPSQPGGPMDPNFFTAQGDGFVCKQTGQLIRGGMLAFYQANAGLARLGLPVTGEIGVPNLTGVTIQRFERGAAVYDPQRQFDNPPMGGDVYYGHIDGGFIYDDMTKPLRDQIAALKQQLQQAQQTPPADPTEHQIAEAVKTIVSLAPQVK